MADGPTLSDLVQDVLDGFLSEQVTELAAISPDLEPVAAAARSMLSGGKRFRARFCYWGWRAAARPDPLDPMPEEPDASVRAAVIRVAAALETLHAAALVHDDLIDRSATRRGADAVHVQFEKLHRAAGWSKSAETFGQAASVLVGDLLQGWADGLFDTGVVALGRVGLAPAAQAAARQEFAVMRSEVTLGQYLDILEEHAWIARDDEDAVARAQRVVIYKSAKYSVEAPLVIGGLLGGADAEQVAALRAFGVPLGAAFQLRDDLLGVFGDPLLTGKPAGDDLREGKRTVLIALARQLLQPGARSLLDDLLGDPELDETQIDMLRRTLQDCGAVDRVESAIEHQLSRALGVLTDAPLAPAAKAELRALADAVSKRSA